MGGENHCRVHSDDLTRTNEEIDNLAWFTTEEAEKALDRTVHESNLAKTFLLHWFETNGKEWKF